jgi:hypothetical protein
MKVFVRAFFGAALAVASIANSHAAVTDAAGDVVSTYTGVVNASLDILSANVEYRAATSQFFVTATMNGAIASAPANSSFIWGFNRGQGTARFAPYPGILFDSTVQLFLDGTFNVNRLVPAPTTSTTGLTGSVSGNTVSALVNASELPSLGFALDQYTWNFWPRVASPTGLPGIPDFAPNNAMQLVETPEPGSLALLALGLSVAFIGAQRSRRRRS